MKAQCLMRAGQIERFAQFLEEHPDFSPLLVGENAQVCGFQVGASFLAIADLETIIATEPQFDQQQADRLLSPFRARRR
jgi:hypothetical protein